MTRASASRRTERPGAGVLRLSLAVGALFCALIALMLATGAEMKAQFDREHALRSSLQSDYEYRSTMRSVLIDLEEAETGQRGYLLTGRRAYLQPYLHASDQVSADLARLRAQAPAGGGRATADLARLSGAKFAELAQTIRLADQGRRGQALAIVLSDRGQRDMDAARAVVAAERLRTSGLMSAWSRLADASARETERAALVMGALMILALAASIALIGHALRQRRRTIANLRSANARVTALLRTSAIAEQISSSGHWSLSAATGEQRWSAGVFEIFGLPVADAPPDVQDVIGRYVEADRHRVQAHVTRAFEAREGFEFEHEIDDARGVRKRLRLKAEFVEDASGGLLIGAVHDVTSEREAQRALEASERRYRHLAESSTDMMATMSIDSTVLFISPACRRILGYEPEELVGRRTLSLTHPDDVPQVLAIFDALRRAGPGETTFAYRFRGRHKDGAWVWLEGQPRVEFDAAGAPVRYQDVVREIGSRKAAEEALESSRAMAIESERRYRLLAENATDMIALYGLDGVISYVSPACSAVLGYSAGELVGRSTLEFVFPDDLARIRSQFAAQQAARTSGAMHTEHRVTRRDGVVIWLEGRPRLVFDAAGAPVGYQDVMRDISLRKAMESELREARTAAEAAARSKSDFLANMSHELRTPLSSIVGFADLISGAAELKAETRRQARIVRNSSRALVEIVNDILDISKIESEGVAISPEPTDLVDLLNSTLALMRRQAEDKGLRLDLGSTCDPGRVLVDPARLRQVIFNLVGNAIKFTERGGVTLSLSEAVGGGLTISVRDSGIGIPQDRLGRIFERFAQADASTSRRFGGTGLGLTICSALVRAMGGELKVESEVGVGSTFWFTIAPPRPSQTVATSPLPAPVLPPAPASTLTGLRVLVADDNVFNQQLFAAFMAEQDLEITFADNGREAVQAAETAAFDLVLMDMQMPIMDGLDATRAIRALGLTSVPIVALTANVVPSHIEACLEAGMNDHLAKPYTAEAVLAMIARWTSGRDRGREQAAPPGAADVGDAPDRRLSAAG